MQRSLSDSAGHEQGRGGLAAHSASKISNGRAALIVSVNGCGLHTQENRIDLLLRTLVEGQERRARRSATVAKAVHRALDSSNPEFRGQIRRWENGVLFQLLHALCVSLPRRFI